MDDKKYIQELEAILSKCLAPIKDIPFPIAIKALSGCRVLSFDKNSSFDQELVGLMAKAAQIAGAKASNVGIYTDRPNEAGNKIEPFVKKALYELGIQADTPRAKSGRRKATGYPDIEITDKHGRTAYLECKTYNLRNIDTTQRAFYFSPS
ncbi:MAG: restriction endonuclease, partial [Candidatus Omnitrophica bacterium]|nr:restriction endonuclease [Candidatus Omnitrophota bacterium]